MSSATLILPRSLAEELAQSARLEIESAAVLIVGVARTSAGLRVLGRELHWVDDEFYERRTNDSLRIASAGYVPALARAEQLSAAAVFFHTHPGSDGSPIPSHWDDIVDDELTETFRIRTGSDCYASLVASPASNWFTFSGRGIDGDQTFQINRVLVAGDRMALLPSVRSRSGPRLPTIFDRQVRAFGGSVQQVLSELSIGVVGCGGTGSAVAEQLVRLGVRSLVLVDNDTISESNLTRVYGSTPMDIGKPKVDVLATHLRTIASDVRVETMNSLVTSEATARALTGCHTLFGCTDDNAGRIVLSRLASHYLIPLIDCGVLISSDKGIIAGIDGRVTIQTPGAACLVCRDRIDLARAAAEQLDPDERKLRQDEGYAPELGRVEPAVVTFTSLVASQAVSELLERLIAFGPEPVPTEVLLRSHEREVSTNLRLPRSGHFCDPIGGRLGTGDSEPFLGQLWRAA